MQDYIEQIDKAINQLLSGELSVVAFKRVFFWFYLGQIPGEFLSDEEWDLYSAIDSALVFMAVAAEPQEFMFIEWVRKCKKEGVSLFT